MSVSAKKIDKSRLGRLLVNRGYISDGQLEQALLLQRRTGQRLGEIMVARGWVSEKAISRTLRHQKRYRYAAAFAAMVAAPLQPMMAFAASAPAAGTPVPEAQRPAGFQPMSDTELGQVSARGLDQFVSQIQDVQAMADGSKKPDSVETLKVLAKSFSPVFGFLDYTLTMQGVHYDPSRSKSQVLADGSIQMALPDRISQVSLQDIHAGTTASMGDLSINDIRFSANSSITVRMMP